MHGLDRPVYRPLDCCHIQQHGILLQAESRVLYTMHRHEHSVNRWYSHQMHNAIVQRNISSWFFLKKNCKATTGPITIPSITTIFTGDASLISGSSARGL